MNLLLLSAKSNSEDNPTWDQAINGPDREGYWQAIKKELETLQNEKHAWDIIDRERWMSVFHSTWTFKYNRSLMEQAASKKEHFCALGDCQIEGVDSFDSLAPVINWSTVCIMFILSIILGL
jgi:hypothetical protein